VTDDHGDASGAMPAVAPDRMYDIGENDAPDGIDAVFATEGEVG